MNFDKRFSVEDHAADEREVGILMLSLQNQEPAWGGVFGRCNVRGDLKTPLISLSMVRGGIITLGFNFGVWRELSYDAQQQAIILTFQKLLTGALSTQGNDLQRAFGDEVTELALLLTLAEVPTDQLAMYGFFVPKPQDLQLKPGLSWQEYCVEVEKLIFKGNMPKEAPPEGWTPEDSDDVGEMGEDHRVVPTESGQAPEVSEQPGLADQVMRGMVNQLEQKYKIRNRGLVAGQGVEWVDALFRPPVFDYRDKLRWMESGRGKVFRKRTITRINRRIDADGARGRIARGSCNVYCFVDTSGSRTAMHIATATPEMRGMVARGATVYLVQVDAEVQDVKRWDGSDEQMEVFGRGGTEIQRAFEQIPQINHKTGVLPAFVVVFSDGYTGSLDCGDHPTLILLDEDGMDVAEFSKIVSGTDVELAIVAKPDKDLM